MLGGTLILVSGVGCLSEDIGKLTCLFGNVSTTGILVQLGGTSSPIVLCKTPYIPDGVTTFQLMAADTTIGSAKYHSCESAT